MSKRLPECKLCTDATPCAQYAAELRKERAIIEAAPEMLEALKGALGWFDDESRAYNGEAATGTIPAMLRAAIAKAEGKDTPGAE